MITTNSTLSKSLYSLFFAFTIGLVGQFSYSQNTPTTPQDTTKTGFSLGKISIPNPQSIVSKYTYDPITDRYIYTESVGNFNINYPIILNN